jgi:uncharacterized repeat protein (TIGR02543 family)
VENYYVLFGVSNNAGSEEIRSAYKAQIKKYHPDNNPGNHVAAKKFRSVMEGGEILLNAASRAEYDRRLREYVLNNWHNQSPAEDDQPPPPRQDSYQQAGQEAYRRRQAEQQARQEAHRRQEAEQAVRQEAYRRQQAELAVRQEAHRRQEAEQQARQEAYLRQEAEQQARRSLAKAREVAARNGPAQRKKLIIITAVCAALAAALVIGSIFIARAVGSPPASEYGVVFYMGDGTDAAYKMQSAVKDAPITDIPDAPGRGGYVFRGWYKDAVCSEAWDFTRDKVTKKLTSLYAKWSEDAPGAFTCAVTYDYRGGTPGPASSEVSYKENFTLTVPDKTGYIFTGWFADAGGGLRLTDEAGGSLSVFTGAFDLTLYAGWDAKTYTVTYSYAGATGNASAADTTVTYGTRYAFAVPERVGYGFLGWYDTAVGGRQLADAFGAANGEWLTDGGLTVYAQWNAIFTVAVYSGTVNGFTEYGKTLGRVTVPRVIDGNAFTALRSLSGGERLKEITIEEGYLTVEDFCFQNSTALETAVLPESLTRLGSYAFSGCAALRSVNIPSKITVLSGRVFQNCASLSELDIPDAVTEIEAAAFAGSGLAAFRAKSGLAIGKWAFEGCTGLKSADLSKAGLSEIPDSMFSGCTALESFTIPASVTKIGPSAFYNCTKIASIEIPSGVSEIGGYAFLGWKPSQTITVRQVSKPAGWDAYWVSAYSGPEVIFAG